MAQELDVGSFLSTFYAKSRPHDGKDSDDESDLEEPESPKIKYSLRPLMPQIQVEIVQDNDRSGDYVYVVDEGGDKIDEEEFLRMRNGQSKHRIRIKGRKSENQILEANGFLEAGELEALIEDSLKVSSLSESGETTSTNFKRTPRAQTLVTNEPQRIQPETQIGKKLDSRQREGPDGLKREPPKQEKAKTSQVEHKAAKRSDGTITFNYTGKLQCSWCGNISLNVRNENTNTISSQYRMCFKCTAARVDVLCCDEHTFNEIPGRIEWLRQHGIENISASMTCSVCVFPAIFRCGTDGGCGLKLCDDCAPPFIMEMNKDMDELVKKRQREEEARGDAILLLSNGPLVAHLMDT